MQGMHCGGRKPSGLKLAHIALHPHVENANTEEALKLSIPSYAMVVWSIKKKKMGKGRTTM